MIRKTLIIQALILLTCVPLRAEEQKLTAPGIRIEGKKTVTVNRSDILLSDIAEVSSASLHDDDAVIALQKIKIDPAPQPGEEVTISASRVLQRLKEDGVRLTNVIYVLPRIVTVNRASRILSLPEIEEALKKSLKEDGHEIHLKQVLYQNPLKVPPSFGNLRASIFQANKPGELGFTLTGSVEGEEDRKYDLTAQIDQWVNIPTAGHTLSKGDKVNPDDIIMARMNVASIPLDTFHTSEEIVGKEVTGDIQYGESFRKNRLNIPPAILGGSKVTLIYTAGALEATATGIAMESGMLGQEIKVRNDSSKKIITGKVLEPGKVGVNK